MTQVNQPAALNLSEVDGARSPDATEMFPSLTAVDAWWRAANYLSAAQIYLLANPLLREPLRLEHIKPRLLGHWGTTPGINLMWAHLNRVIIQRDLNVLFVCGPGHGGPGLVASAYLDGTYSEVYPDVGQDVEGLLRLCRQFSFPGGVPSHAAPETPGSIHEGGELGYSLSHSFGAAFDNPDLVVACMIGDGEAETGPLAASWHSNKFLNPVNDGVVLPILHLNGYKIANPSVLARLAPDELDLLLRGYGWAPYEVAGDDPELVHAALRDTLDTVFDEIKSIQHRARVDGDISRPRWPCIVLRTPKGWTGPSVVDGVEIEGTWRSHQLPLAADAAHPEHVALLDEWLRSYRPDELFDANGAVSDLVASVAPAGARRMSANPHANGGLLLKPLRLPSVTDYAIADVDPGVTTAEATRVLGAMLRDTLILNAEARNFRVFGPDETASNRLGTVFETTGRTWMGERSEHDTELRLEYDGRVMEILSEHTVEGWLEGYLLTGRHGLFSCYEAFIHLVDSMFNQHAKWLKVSSDLAWRADIASLNYLLTSHVWRQDHNGFSHQDPGFIDHVANKKPEHVRVYLPPDANTLLAVADHCLRSRHKVNVIVAGKQPALQYLNIDEAIAHCTKGAGIWEWASNDAGVEPDVVMACCGEVPTLEALAAVKIIRAHAPELRIRVVNVVDLMCLSSESDHPHGLSDAHFDALFTVDRPVIFNYHGYPSLIHKLTYRRRNHPNFHVRGYNEEGTTTTPFDMCVLNRIDRFHLVMDVIDRVPSFGPTGAYLREHMADELIRHRAYICEAGEDLPEIRGWTWSDEQSA